MTKTDQEQQGEPKRDVDKLVLNIALASVALVLLAVILAVLVLLVRR